MHPARLVAQVGAAWNEGGKEAAFGKMNITMTHDELEAALGSKAVQLIAEAGFVLVPRKWREDVFAERSRSARAEKVVAHDGG